MKPPHNLTGRRFGKLTVIEQAPHIGKHRAWRCKCKCGGDHIVRTQQLVSGATRSCGCSRRKNDVNLKIAKDPASVRRRAKAHQRAAVSRVSFNDVVDPILRAWPESLARLATAARGEA